MTAFLMAGIRRSRPWCHSHTRRTRRRTKSLTRESRFDSRLQIRGGSLEPRRSDRGRVAYFAGFVAGRTEAWKARPRAPARGQSIAFDLTAGEAADCKSYDTLIDLSERAPGA